ncbi:MFS transporter [Candidatus Poriferisodalis sp.]|uniref:MFS transporter n=1 Tax=Candidatus Poriferisodalis sp. TaxID=3101277 RepID=UPI003B0290D6
MSAQPAHLDSARGWVTACGAAVVIMAGFGTIYSFTAFAGDMADEFDTGLGPISIVFGITVFLYFGSALLSGRLYDRFGIVPLLVGGGALFVSGLVATSYVTVLWHGYVLYGIGLGFGGGMFNAPLFALVALWFVRHRAMAQGIVATGSGLGTMIYVPFAQRLLGEYGWRVGMRWLALIAVVILLLGLAVIRQPPRPQMGDSRRHLALLLRTPTFWQLGASMILFTIAVIGTIGLVIPFAQDDGVPELAAGWLVFVVGLSSIVGRLALTGLARPLGSVRLLKIAFGGLPVAFAIWLVTTRVSSLEAKYVLLVIFAALLGVCYGGFVALIGDVTAHLFGLASLGAVVGRFFFFSSIGALVGPPLLGFAHDASGGVSVPILAVGVIALAGAVVLLPTTRHPLPLPTYLAPGDVPPPMPAVPPVPPSVTPAAGRAVSVPTRPRAHNGQPLAAGAAQTASASSEVAVAREAVPEFVPVAVAAETAHSQSHDPFALAVAIPVSDDRLPVAAGSSPTVGAPVAATASQIESQIDTTLGAAASSRIGGLPGVAASLRPGDTPDAGGSSRAVGVRDAVASPRADDGPVTAGSSGSSPAVGAPVVAASLRADSSRIAAAPSAVSRGVAVPDAADENDGLEDNGLEDNGLAAVLAQPRSAALRASPPAVYWPVPAATVLEHGPR